MPDPRNSRFLLCWCVLSVCVAAGAQEVVGGDSGAKTKGNWSAELSLKNRDLWRGFTDGGATAEMEVTYARGPWEVCTAISLEGGVTAEDHNQSEIDLEITRRFHLRHDWSFLAGYEYYGTSQEEHAHAHEFWAGAGYTGRVDFSLKAYQFAMPRHGSYFSAEAGRTLLTRGRLSLRGESSLGFNRHMLVDGAGFSDVALKVIPSIRTGRVTVAPFFMYSKTLNKAWFGNQIALGVSFQAGKAD